MLQRLDKFAPFIVLALLGYVTYSVVQEPNACAQEGKKPPQITKRMLTPVPITATANASPANRDPFEVAWASYRDPGKYVEPTSKPTTRPASQPTTKPTTAPAPLGPPALAGRLRGVYVGGDLRMAVIGDKLYKVGSLVEGIDPMTCWRVVAISNERVVLQFQKTRRVLRIHTDGRAPASRPASGGGQDR